MNIRANSERGFSLIELLVVVAIIGVLAAVGVVGYQGYIDSTKNRSRMQTRKLFISGSSIPKQCALPALTLIRANALTSQAACNPPRQPLQLLRPAVVSMKWPMQVARLKVSKTPIQRPIQAQVPLKRSLIRRAMPMMALLIAQRC